MRVIIYLLIKIITRDVEVKSNLTIARGEWGGDSGEGIVVYRSYYKGHMDKIKGEGGGGGRRRGFWLWWGGGIGRKGIQL